MELGTLKYRNIMGTKQTYIELLSRSVRVYQPEAKREFTAELNSLESDVTELTYKAWVIETFVIGINSVYEAVLELNTEAKKKKAKEDIYKAVLKLNPQLTPEDVYIDGSGLTFTKTKYQLTESKHWKVTEENSNIPLIEDFHRYFELSRQARKHDHTVETEYSKVLNMGVKIRVFRSKDKKQLMFGLYPKNKQQLRYYIINTCIDSFHEIYQLLRTSNDVPLKAALDDLYSWAIYLNPFLDLTLRQVRNINKTTATHREAFANVEEESPNYKGYTSLSQISKEELDSLEETLLTKVFGQDEAVKAVANAYKRAVSGVGNPKTPIGAFLFYGGTSTGKTELARVVSKLVTNSEKGLLKISCNTLQASHSLATLIGSPPGYVGHDESGYLASHMKDSQLKVILFDEVDKAHPNIYDLLLEMLEEGTLLLANGEVLDFSKCLIIFTSNMGQQEAEESSNTAGFSAELADHAKIQEDSFAQVLKKKLKPEFLSRLTGKFYFKKLSDASLTESCRRYLDERTEQLDKNKIWFSYQYDLAELLLLSCKFINPKGVHPRILNTYAEDKVFKRLGDFLIKNNLLHHKKKIHIDLTSFSPEEVQFQKVGEMQVKKTQTAKGKTK